MRNSFVVAVGLSLGWGLVHAAHAQVVPECTTISVVMLPAYSCELDGLVFSNFVFDATPRKVGETSLAYGPDAYDILFGVQGRQVILTYQPIGSPEIFAGYSDDPGLNQPPPPFLSPHTISAAVSFSYRVTVRPLGSAFGVTGLSAQFSALATGASGYFAQATVTQVLQSSIANAQSIGIQQSTSINGLTTSQTFGNNLFGHNLSNAPLSTGNILPGFVSGGTTFDVNTNLTVFATSAQNAPSQASAVYQSGQWSNTFTVTPEPSTITLVAIGLLSLAGGELVRRRRKAVTRSR